MSSEVKNNRMKYSQTKEDAWKERLKVLPFFQFWFLKIVFKVNLTFFVIEKYDKF